ncbi:MAG: hypothetical protein ABFC24_02355 [Methanoregulaceae archaeon]
MNPHTREEKTDVKPRDKPDGPDSDEEKTELEARHPGPGRRHGGSGRHGGRRKTGAERWAEGEDSPLLDASQDCMG